MDKRQEIVSTAIELFVQHGFHGTSTALITQEASVGTGTLFTYFANKGELVNQLFAYVVQDLTSFLATIRMEPSAFRSTFIKIWMAAFDWALSNPSYFNYLQQFRHTHCFSTVSNQILLDFQALLNPYFQRGITEGLFVDLPANYLYYHFINHLFNSLQFVIEQQFTIEDKLIQDCFEMEWKSLLR